MRHFSQEFSPEAEKQVSRGDAEAQRKQKAGNAAHMNDIKKMKIKKLKSPKKNSFKPSFIPDYIYFYT